MYFILVLFILYTMSLFEKLTTEYDNKVLIVVSVDYSG